jgi:hypothetical protein
MKYWRREHANGWTAEVRLATDGRFYHRTYESHLVPAGFVDWRVGLWAAQTAADARVPLHACHCMEWQEWV